jgi:putative lipoprotein (rSAM/lipoprotein system)
MKMTKKFTPIKNIYKKTLLLLGAMLGFSSAIVAQYGAPMAHYKITGTIKSKGCEVPIPKIQVKFSEDQRQIQYSYPVFTDSSGKFELYFYEDYGTPVDKKKIILIAEDMDEENNNGDFLLLEQSFILKQKTGVNKYDKNFESIEIYMDYKGKSPCNKELPEDTTPVIQVPVEKLCILTDSIIPASNTKDTLLNEISENTDTVKSFGRVEPPLVNQDLIIVLPNPSKGQFTIEVMLEKPAYVSLIIYDSESKLILSEKWGNCEGMLEKQISLEGKAPGTYFLILKAGNETFTKKLIMQ